MCLKMVTKIYVLVAYAKDDRTIDLGYSDSLETTRNEIKSIETLEQLKELWIDECKLKIRDNYYPINYYGLEHNNVNQI